MLGYSWRMTRVMFLTSALLGMWQIYLAILAGANQMPHFAGLLTGGVATKPSVLGLFIVQTQLTFMPWLLAFPYFAILVQTAANDGAVYGYLLTRPVRKDWFVWSQWLTMAGEIVAVISLSGAMALAWLYFVHGPIRANLLASARMTLHANHLTGGLLIRSFVWSGGLWWLIGLVAAVLTISGGLQFGALYRQTREPNRRRLAALAGLLGIVPLILGMGIRLVSDLWSSNACDCGDRAALEPLHPWWIGIEVVLALAWPVASLWLLRHRDT